MGDTASLDKKDANPRRAMWVLSIIGRTSRSPYASSVPVESQNIQLMGINY